MGRENEEGGGAVKKKEGKRSGWVGGAVKRKGRKIKKRKQEADKAKTAASSYVH